MRFLIGFLITIGLIIVVFILIFRGGADDGGSAEQQKMLVDYANTSTVMQYTRKGPVQADQSFNEIRITVSNQEVAMEVFKGYEGNLINVKTYNNNSAAYADFLAALQRAGYTQGNPDESLSDSRGACANGSRFIMGIKDGDEDIQEYWSSSCGGSANPSFEGSTRNVIRLYEKQVPDYSTLTSGLNL